VNRNPQNPNVVDFCITSGRRTPDGQEWCDYDVSVSYLFSTVNLETANEWFLKQSAIAAPGIRKGAETALQTAWGPTIATDLYYDCPFNYTENRRVFIAQRPGAVFIIQLAAPSDQYARMQPVFQAILDSVTFS
jgi:hypothetical protein